MCRCGAQCTTLPCRQASKTRFKETIAMNRNRLLYAIVSVVVISCLGAIGWAQVSAAGVNYEKVALLKWYAANVTTTFSVGHNPRGVAFDGANIWVTDPGSGGVTVSKLQAADGATLGTFSVGRNPTNVASDGANIWVTNTADG